MRTVSDECSIEAVQERMDMLKIIISGYTPYPTFEADTRLPHFADKITRQIHKTALGAESVVQFEKRETLEDVLLSLKKEKTILIALEQYPGSLSPKQCIEMITKKYPDRKLALLLGNEIHGVDDSVLKQMDLIMEIPMLGLKESFNVSIAAGIALYELSSI